MSHWKVLIFFIVLFTSLVAAVYGVIVAHAYITSGFEFVLMQETLRSVYTRSLLAQATFIIFIASVVITLFVAMLD